MSLTDIKHKEYKININGQDCLLNYNYKAHAYIQENTGKSRNEIINLLLNDDLTVKDEIFIIKAGLLKHCPDITIEEIENLNPIELAKEVVPAFLESVLPPKIIDDLYFDESEKKKTLIQKILGCLNIPGQKLY